MVPNGVNFYWTKYALFLELSSQNIKQIKQDSTKVLVVIDECVDIGADTVGGAKWTWVDSMSGVSTINWQVIIKRY